MSRRQKFFDQVKEIQKLPGDSPVSLYYKAGALFKIFDEIYQEKDWVKSPSMNRFIDGIWKWMQSLEAKAGLKFWNVLLKVRCTNAFNRGAGNRCGSHSSFSGCI
jgi:hypothetical protein